MSEKKQRHTDSKLIAPPSEVRIESVSENGIRVEWKPMEDADGYELRRSYRIEGPYELIFTSNKGDTNRYLDNSFAQNQKKVYYKLRSCVKDSSGEVRFSVMTQPVMAACANKMTLSLKELFLYDGVERKLKAFRGWSEAKDAVWTSSDPGVAVAEQDGTVRGIRTGRCLITCRSKSARVSAVCSVTVNRAAEPYRHALTGRYVFNPAKQLWQQRTASDRKDRAVLILGGDLRCERRQLMKQQAPGFTESFRFLREVTADADLAAANLETLIAPGWPYSIDEPRIDNYFNYNAPDSYLEAVRYGGFDALMLANNHNCDGGIRALQETCKQLDAYEFPGTGISPDGAPNTGLVFEINRIRVGFVSYNSADIGFQGLNWTEAEKEKHLHIFSGSAAKRDIALLKETGAEFVVVYMHWGKLDSEKVTEAQRREAMLAAEAGADLIVGSNPQVIQKFEEVQTSAGAAVPCFYSLGNLLAARDHIPPNRDSVLVKAKLVKENGTVSLSDLAYIPMHTYSEIDGVPFAPTALVFPYHLRLERPDREARLQDINERIGTDFWKLQHRLTTRFKTLRPDRRKLSHVRSVCERTGWDMRTAERRMREAFQLYGMPYNEYAMYSFWQVPEDIRGRYLSTRYADLLVKKYNTRNVVDTMRNKDRFLEEFSEFLGRNWLSTNNMTFRRFQILFSGDEKVIYKPKASHGGKGIRVYDLTTQKLQTVYNELAQLPEGVIESYLTQHPQMNRLSKKSINTMRVVTIRTNDPSHGLEQDRVYFVYAFVRMGRGDSFLDNMHSGGLGAFLELNSGTVITEGISMALEAYEHHPDTGERIPGFQIPMYKEAMEMVTRAASRVYGYLGWDVAFTPNGPVLIECNSQPGTEPVQGPFHLRSIGMKGAIDRYL